jgi:hypothetical protein
MDLYKINLINKINNINCKKTLTIIFLILKANKVKYIENDNGIYINLNQDINKDLLEYINEIISDYKPIVKNNEEKSIKKLSYNINEYMTVEDTLYYKINNFKQKNNKIKRKQNSLIYNNIMKLINNN